MSTSNQSFIRTARSLTRRLNKSKLSGHVRGVVLVPPARGRSVVYASLGNDEFYEHLKEHSDFCRDTHLGGALHLRATSFRQVNRTPSLHVSLEGDDRLAVHLDRSGPAVGRSSDGGCIYEHSLAAKHLWDDILPSIGWKWGGPPPAGRRRESPSAGGRLPMLPYSLSRPGIRGRDAAPLHQPERGPSFSGLEGGEERRSRRTPPARPPPAAHRQAMGGGDGCQPESQS